MDDVDQELKIWLGKTNSRISGTENKVNRFTFSKLHRKTMSRNKTLCSFLCNNSMSSKLKLFYKRIIHVRIVKNS